MRRKVIIINGHPWFPEKTFVNPLIKRRNFPKLNFAAENLKWRENIHCVTGIIFINV